MPTEPPPLHPRVRANPTSVTAAKLAVIGGLLLLLCIPLLLTQGLLRGRAERQRKAEQAITSTWGTAQTLVGPILSVPYRRASEPDALAVAHFLPDELVVDGQMDPSVRKRGIFKAVVYRGDITVSGSFEKPSFDAWKVAPEEILWEDATVSFGISDLRGTHEAIRMTFSDREIVLEPGTRCPVLTQGLHGKAGAQLRDAASAAFSMSLGFKGSRTLSVAPLGAQTQVRLRSAWPDPTFVGAELPVDRRVDARGFEATWRGSFYQRPFPAQWTDADGPMAVTQERLHASLFGVELMQVVDPYRLTERAIKYGILFIVLVFTAFFLFEVCSPLRLHPVQYLLVGFALCLFFLALLALSEFVGFSLAYAAGACASSALIVLYSHRVLRGGRRAGIVAAELGVVYLFLFVVLRLQDYALLAGTGGLFAALAAVMYATRNIDWYARDRGEPEGQPLPRGFPPLDTADPWG